MTKDKGCQNCGSSTSIFRTRRYFSCGEAVCECRKCGYLLSSKIKGKNENQKIFKLQKLKKEV